MKNTLKTIWKRLSPSGYLFRKPIHILWIVLLGACASHALNLLFSLLPLNELLESYRQVENVLFSNGTAWLILRAVILIPLLEELVFRGVIFRLLNNRLGFLAGALISAALFGLYHMNLPQGIYAFVFGLLLAYVYDKYQNILASVLVHCSANLLSVLLTLTGAAYPSTAVYVIAMVLMFAAAIAILLFVVRKVPQNPNE